MGLPGHIAAQNRRARHDYFIVSEVEAGIMLVGTEVKSLRAGKGNINEAFAGPMQGELYLFNAYIPEYQSKMPFPHETRRPRKLLLHKREIAKLYSLVTQRGLTLVPLTVYLKQGKVKLEIGVARGKKLYDKRRSIAERDAQRAREIATKVAR